MSITDRNNLGFDFESPAYRYGTLQTQANNCLCIPIVYGRARAAGNKIWQSSGSETFKALVCFAEGQITGFSDIRINEILITDSALAGSSYTTYLGNGSQEIDARVPGNTQAEKATLVGGLKHTSYLALTITANAKVANNYMDVTAVIQGKAIRTYSDTTSYTKQYSNNPAWCLLDFLTCYNGCGLSHDEIDIQSFIEAAKYCSEKINPVIAIGNVNVKAGTTTVTGSGTDFINETKIGDQITINGESKEVVEVKSKTSLIIDSAFSSVITNQSMIIKDTRYTLNLILDTRKTRQDWINEILVCCRGFLVYKGGKIALIIDKGQAVIQSFTQNDIIMDSEVFWTTPKEQRCDIFKIRYLDPNNEYARAFAVAEADSFLNDPPIIQEIIAFGITNFKQASRLSWYYLNQANTCDKFISFKTTHKALDRSPGDIIQLTSTFLGYQDKKLAIISMQEEQEGQIQLICREYNPNIYSDILASAEPVFNTVTIDDVLGIPDDVAKLSSAQNYNTIALTWTPIASTQVTYEIREGTSWDNSSVIVQNLTGQSYTILDIIKGKHTYWIKSVNKYGNYSNSAATSAIEIKNLIDVHTVVNENILDDDLSEGTFVNCSASQGRVILNPVTNWTNSGTWNNTGQTYAPEGYWGAKCETTGTYTTKIYEMGDIIGASISINYNLNSLDSTGDITTEWRYSEDNETWTDWQFFTPGNYTFSCYQFKLTLNSPNKNYTALTSFIINIDITAKDLYFQDKSILNAVSGVTVNFEPSFATTPAVVANISDGTKGYCVVTSKSTSQATVMAYDNLGNAITAKVDIRVKGY